MSTQQIHRYGRGKGSICQYQFSWKRSRYTYNWQSSEVVRQHQKVPSNALLGALLSKLTSDLPPRGLHMDGSTRALTRAVVIPFVLGSGDDNKLFLYMDAANRRMRVSRLRGEGYGLACFITSASLEGLPLRPLL
jgi:hypothetical protein